MKVKFKHWNCVAVSGYYANGRRAIKLIEDPSREQIAVATVNVVDCEPGEGAVFIKDYSENVGMADALIEAGIIHSDHVRTIGSGFVCISSYRLTEKALKLWEK